ncbi:hypothetical protein KUV85_05880 [Nocardioides panacisoli]|uniref:hypothetical protein n=1 Tax=Nocardioides panacisoli TaxID=627624 RepID=UPI001C631C3D|nr:hypothetical protein [Nocardioides panacisoli]QYJ05209.1 hypothetical protein KUV85_05880 [Nocardioides panacisoli]
MTGEFAVPAWLAVLVLLALLGLVAATVALLVVVRRVRQHTEEVVAAASVRADELGHHLAEIEERLDASEPATSVPAREEDPEYLITELGKPRPAAPMLPGPAFADQVVRESMVRAASLVAGLRRALAPETRNRIRFEMKREVKRSRKQRRADVKQAVREWEARQRESVDA